MWPDSQPPLVIGIAVVGAAYLCLFAVAELARRAGASGSLTRRIVHVGSAAPALAVPWLFDSIIPVVVLAGCFTGLMLASRRLGLLGSIHDIPRRTHGAELYPIALGASFVLGYGSPFYFVAVLALGIGDTAAAVVGDRQGRRTFVCWGAQRSVEGTVAAAALTALATFAVLIVSGNHDPIALSGLALAVGSAAALAEAASPRGLDNLTMPLAALAMLAAAQSLAVAVGLLGLLAVVVVLGIRSPTTLVRPAVGGPDRLADVTGNR